MRNTAVTTKFKPNGKQLTIIQPNYLSWLQALAAEVLRGST